MRRPLAPRLSLRRRLVATLSARRAAQSACKVPFSDSKRPFVPRYAPSRRRSKWTLTIPRLRFVRTGQDASGVQPTSYSVTLVRWILTQKVSRPHAKRSRRTCGAPAQLNLRSQEGLMEQPSEAARAWWRGLDPAERSRLRRCRVPSDALVLRETLALIRALDWWTAARACGDPGNCTSARLEGRRSTAHARLWSATMEQRGCAAI